MERKKNWMLILAGAVFILMISVLYSKDVSASAGSRQDAVNWVYAQEGKSLDYDHAYGAQCVDLIKYYYDYFGQAGYAKGNANEYVSNALPEGWTRIQKTSGFIPEPGDIAVWGADLNSSGTGHVAIVLSANENSFVSMDQNWPSGSACKQVTHTYNKFWGVIRPDFDESSISVESPVDVGTNFYAYIINTATWLHATNDDSGNVSARNTSYESNQIWYFERQNDGSYKITSCKDGRCMEVHNFETANGTNVEMNNWSDNSAQRWFIYGNSGQYKFRAACGNNVLDLTGGSQSATDGTNLEMWEKNGTDAQDFSIWVLEKPELGVANAEVASYGDDAGNNIKITWNNCDNNTGYDVRIFDEAGENVLYTYWNVQGTSYVASIPAGTYQVQVTALNNKFNIWKDGTKKTFRCSNNLGTNFYAYIINTATWLHATNDSGNVSACNTSYQADQIWYFERQSDGSYKITSCKDGRCMEVHNFETANGTNVEMNNWSNNSAQKWFIYGNSGHYKFRAACGSNMLDLIGGSQSAADGSNLGMWEENETDAQDFSIWILEGIKGTLINAEMTLGKEECSYDGKAKTPDITIMMGTDTLTENVDYTLTFSDNVNAGTATVTATGKGSYTGQCTKQFTINKAEQKLSAYLSSDTIKEGDTEKINISAQGTVIFSSDNEDIAKVSEDGVITATGFGKTIITIKAKAEQNYKEATITVVVNVEHAYNSGVILEEANCIQEGEKLFTCSQCGQTYTKTIPVNADAHNWSDPITYLWEDGKCTAERICRYNSAHKITAALSIIEKRKDASCTENGEIVYTASGAFNDGIKAMDTKIITLEALGHDYQDIVTKPACSKDGYTTHTCSRCGNYYIDTIIPATGHTYGEPVFDVERKEAIFTCDTCGDTQMIKAKMKSEIEQEATCTEKGRIIYYISVEFNGSVYYDQGQMETDKIPHTPLILPGTTAKCTKDGLTEGAICEVCGTMLSEQTIIPATGHKNVEIRNKVEATEEKEGYSGDTYCKDCGMKLSFGEIIPKKIVVQKKKNSVSDSGGSEQEFEFVKTGDLVLAGLSNKIAAGKKIQLTVTFTPSNASNQNVVWTSSNPKVATVNQNGVVTFKKKSAGKSVIITAMAADGSGAKAVFKLKSMKGVVKKVAISGAKKRTVKAGKALKLKAKVTATKGANKKLQWTSSNTKYATVSASGKVKTKKAGKGKTVKITAMATDGSGKKQVVKVRIK